MNHETENYILQTMSKYLDNRQMIKLRDVLQESIRQSDDTILEKSSQELLEMFIATKRLEGRSEKTLLLYRYNIQKLLDRNNKNVCVMNTDDMAYGGSGYPVDVTGEALFEAVEEPYNGKPYHIKLNLPPLAGIYFMKVKDPVPKKAAKKSAAKKAPARRAAPKKSAAGKAASSKKTQ